MNYATGGVVAEVAVGGVIGGILAYFGITSETLIILTVFLGLDVLFGVIESYVITKNTSSTKLIQGLAKKFTRRALPFIFIAALRGAGYDDIGTMATMIMTILIISEAYSIVGHIYSINTGKSLPEIDALKWIIENVANILKGQLPKKDDEQDGESIQ